MVKGGACGKLLSTAEAVKCGQCPVLYHRACVGPNALRLMNAGNVQSVKGLYQRVTTLLLLLGAWSQRVKI
ncbi:unnamed protein product [Parnassius mnemosyne]|uniref:Zinc finger PHD-type domain-containing protein n=1 Tax=Parnassius mnemosyne TaxID=213953 RepID=A0AAV1LIH7_9NEOP